MVDLIGAKVTSKVSAVNKMSKSRLQLKVAASGVFAGESRKVLMASLGVEGSTEASVEVLSAQQT